MLRQITIMVGWLCLSIAWVMGAPSTLSTEVALKLVDGDHLRLGDVPIGMQKARFRVQNRSQRPLHVDKVSASCTCMKLEFDKGPMAPGEVRECVVDINVQAGNRKTTAVIFDMAAPSTDRVVKMISFQGIQEDRLEVRVDPPELSLAAGEVREVTLDCRWISHQPIELGETIQLDLDRPKGVELLHQEEIVRQDKELCSRYTVRLDARSLNNVSAGLSFHAGMPIRASEVGKLDFTVSPSLTLHPTTLLVDGEALAGDRLGDVHIALADGWTVDSVDSPAWIDVEVMEGELHLALADMLPTGRGTGQVEVKAAHASGLQVKRTLKCILDR